MNVGTGTVVDVRIKCFPNRVKPRTLFLLFLRSLAAIASFL